MASFASPQMQRMDYDFSRKCLLQFSGGAFPKALKSSTPEALSEKNLRALTFFVQRSESSWINFTERTPVFPKLTRLLFPCPHTFRQKVLARPDNQGHNTFSFFFSRSFGLFDFPPRCLSARRI